VNQNQETDDSNPNDLMKVLEDFRQSWRKELSTNKQTKCETNNKYLILESIKII
jgi:hypothetical protein